MTATHKKKRHFSPKHIALLFLFYWAFAAAVVALATIYVKWLMQPLQLALLGIGSLVFAGVSTWVHVRKGKRTAIDDMADRL
jgi:energy-coupling factor transporter transmembrane protein EcfT